MTKNQANRLGFAVLLVFFRERGRFPRDTAEVDAQAICALIEQLDLPHPLCSKRCAVEIYRGEPTRTPNGPSSLCVARHRVSGFS